MSNNIYDILNKLPKDNPVSVVEAQPIYESVDPRGDILEAVKTLEAKYEQQKEKSNDEINYLNPQARRFVQLAKAKFPETDSDLEAVVAAVGDKTQELDQRDKETADWMARAKATIDAQQKEIADTERAVVDANDRYDAQEKRFQDFNRQVAASELDVKQQAQAALDYAKQPGAVPADIISKVKAELPTQPTAEPITPKEPEQPKASRIVTPLARTPNPVTKPEPKIEPKDEKSQAKPFDPTTLASNDDEMQDELDFGQSGNKVVNMKENTEMLKEYKENQPQLGYMIWDQLLKAWKQRLPKVDLNFDGRHLTLWIDQIYGILTDIGSDQNAERRQQRIENILSSYNETINILMSARCKKFIKQYEVFAKQDPAVKAAKAKQKELSKAGQEELPGMQPGVNYKLPAGSRSEEMQENLGNYVMSANVKKLEENLLERFMNFKEAAKPDFLDLDKDGDTEESMKKAAKDAKKHEPADIDKDAVAKRKRLQALKDKQEDERAEKGDDYKSSSRFVKGRAYGGAAQKDDEEKDLDESGLQAYLGKKKYGKEGMKALQKAGREGASKEKMAILRAKHDKMDEARPSRADKVTKDLTSIADKKGYKSAKDFTRQDWDKVAKPHGYTGKEIAAVRGHKVEEVAPPGAKAERMVKHIKKGYAKDGNLSKKEKGIAYATAWKAHNKGQVEEATNFGDTIKNSAGKMTKAKVTVKEGKDAIRNHPIYTTKEAWDHYAEELAEQEMMDQTILTPVVDAEQELAEIAGLAGLTYESKCSSCGCSDCKCESLNEAATRKDFRQVADLIKQIPDANKRKELAHHHSDIFKQQNPRFKHDVFCKACGVDECDYNMGAQPTAIIVGEGDTCPTCDCAPCKCDEGMMEADVEEGNEFSGALAAAKASGAKDFEVGGKKYTVKEDINVNVSATGEEDVVNLIRKLSGMAVVAVQAQPAMAEEVVAEEGPKERDVEYTNTPREDVAGIEASIPPGGDLNRAKKQYRKEYPGDNPMAVAEAKEEQLWKAYEELITDVKA